MILTNAAISEIEPITILPDLNDKKETINASHYKSAGIQKVPNIGKLIILFYLQYVEEESTVLKTVGLILGGLNVK